MESEIPSAIRLTIHACRGFCINSLGCLGCAPQTMQLMRKKHSSVIASISYNMISTSSKCTPNHDACKQHTKFQVVGYFDDIYWI